MIGDDFLAAAFRALGTAPSRREIGVVADSLRRSGAEGAVCAAAEDDSAWKLLVRLAEANGSSGFVALDLIVAVTAGPEALAREAVWEL